MLEPIETAPDGVVAYWAVGNVSAEDYETTPQQAGSAHPAATAPGGARRDGDNRCRPTGYGRRLSVGSCAGRR